MKLITQIFAIAAMSAGIHASAAPVVFDSDSELASDGSYSQTKKINGKSVTMTITAASDFVQGNAVINQFENSKDSTCVLGVFGGKNGSGGKPDQTIEIDHDSGKKESLQVIFSEDVVLSSWSLGDIAASERAEFKVGNKVVYSDTGERGGEFLSSLVLPAGQALEVSADKSSKGTASSISFRSLGIESSSQSKGLKVVKASSSSSKKVTVKPKSKVVISDKKKNAVVSAPVVEATPASPVTEGAALISIGGISVILN